MICSVSKRTCKRTCLSLSRARALSLSAACRSAPVSRARARSLSLQRVEANQTRECRGDGHEVEEHNKQAKRLEGHVGQRDDRKRKQERAGGKGGRREERLFRRKMNSTFCINSRKMNRRSCG